MPINVVRSIQQKKLFEVRPKAPHRIIGKYPRPSIDNHTTIMDDSFIRSHIGDLLRSLRTQYLIDLIKPYTRLELSFLAKVCDRHTEKGERRVINLFQATEC